MFSRCIAALSATPLLALSLALTGCSDSAPASGTNAPSTAPVASAPAAVSETSTLLRTQGSDIPPITTAAPTPAANQPAFVIDVKPDPVKYPQDTPEKAFESIAKSIEGNDLAYQIAWLSTPDFTQRMLAKYKTIEAAAAANQSEKSVAGRQMMLKSIRDMQAAKSTTEGEEKGVKWFRYALGDTQFIQLEKQRDGRWCMNPAVRAK